MGLYASKAARHEKKQYALRIERLPAGHGVGRPIAELLEQTARLQTSTCETLPASVDLRPRMPPVYDQGRLGSCTANALCGAMQFERPALPQGSRLFLYYNERRLEHDVPDDAGATLADGVTCLERLGVCPETEWPYDIAKFAKEPTARCYVDAAKNRAVSAYNLPVGDAATMKKVLASCLPFVVGIAVYPSFEAPDVAATGVVPMPGPKERSIGGHAVLCVGYDDARGAWLMRNSWGAAWGDKGYFYLPYAYLLDPLLSSDMWSLA